MKIQNLTNESEWLAARRKGVGASEAAIIFGLPGYKSIRRVWGDKTGRSWGVFDNVSSGMEEMGEAGHRFEEANAQWFADKTGLEVRDPGEYCLYWSEEHPMSCTPDRMIMGSELCAVLELKLAFMKQARIWAHAVPTSYQIQVQHQMYCCELETAYISVIMDGYKHRWFKINRNERFIAQLIRRVEWFWKHVEAGTPPPVDESPDMMDTLASQYAEPAETRVDLPFKFTAITEEIAEHAAIEKEAKAKGTFLKNQVRDAIGDNTTGVLICGDQCWNWKPGKRGRTLRKGKVHND